MTARGRGRCATAVAAVLIAAASAGCGTDSTAGPVVVVSTNILGDVVHNLTGEDAEVVVLMPPDSDPHSFQISARQAHELRRADLLVSNGLGLEEGIEQHLAGARAEGVPALVAGEVIDVVPYAEGASAGNPDPHFWTDPARMAGVVDAVTTALLEVEGIDAAAVRARADAYQAELAALDAEMAAAFAALPENRRALVTNHHVFGYLADRFDFEVIGAVIPGGTTLAAPSAADLRDLATAIEAADVPTIFAESSQPDRLVQVLAAQAGLDVEVVELFTESLTAPGGGADTYLTMMRANTERITNGLAP